jgi:mannitol 2-dehydrogenase
MSDISLSRATLGQLPPRLLRPSYDVENVRAGIVHLGLGAFHRAHMARYTHDLMERKVTASEWGIVGAGLCNSDWPTWQALKPQDCLYTLVERQGERVIATIIGSLCGMIYAAESSASLLAAIDDPAIRIVSLTVTENGYCLNPATKSLDPGHAAIVHDLSNPRLPQSPIGIIVEACRRRRAVGGDAFTVLSCDNIPHNGVVLHDAVQVFAELRDPALAEWIETNTSFPSTMVDRITPISTAEDVAALGRTYGIADRGAIFSEIFRQWVIEERFVGGRPEWEAVDVQFVRDVLPYELMKLRLLNASHLAIASLGQLAGYTYVDQTMRDPVFRHYMIVLMDSEAGPTLPPIPGVNLIQYKCELIDRFANPRIKDTLQRINSDASVNLLLDPIRDRLKADAGCKLLALALAAWMRRAQGFDDAGRELKIDHPNAALLHRTALKGGDDPRALLELRFLFGDLILHEAFVETLHDWLRKLATAGARATLAMALE